MEIAYWIVAGVLAAAFLFAGVFKIATPKEKLKASGMNWTDSYSQAGARGIGTAEVLGGIGAHRKLGEPVIANIILGLLAVAAAVLGFLVWV